MFVQHFKFFQFSKYPLAKQLNYRDLNSEHLLAPPPLLDLPPQLTATPVRPKELDGREWIHVHVWLSSFAVHLKLSQYC